MSIVLGLALLAPASAQDGGFDAHGFRLASAASDTRDPLGFVRPGAQGALDWYAGGVLEYASRPLVFEPAPDQRVVALSNVVAANLAGGFAPVAPLRLDLSMPVFFASSSDAGSYGAGLGDLRLQATALPVRPDVADGGFGLGLLAALDLPTGDAATYRGTDGFAGLVGASMTLEADDLTTSFQAAFRLAPSTAVEERPAPTRGGDALELAGHLGYRIGELVGAGIEARVSLPTDPAVREAIGIPAEAIASARAMMEGGGYVSAGLGVGLGSGAGASPVRLVVGGGFGTPVDTTPKDTDGDGLADKLDACPTEAEVVNGYQDDDGCPDERPQVVFVAKLGDAPAPTAKLTLKVAQGEDPVEGEGSLVRAGLPGEPLVATARLGACQGGTSEAKIPAEGSLTVEVPIALQTGEVVVGVTDASGRPLETAMVRYILSDPSCAPADAALRNGRGVHRVGTGKIMVFVTAPGYDVHQTEFELAEGGRQLIDAKLKPTQVQIKGDTLKVLTGGVVFVEGTATLDDKSIPLLHQIASLTLGGDVPKLEVLGFGEGKDAKRQAQERAEAVVAFLTNLGVPPDHLVATGKGALPKGQTERVQFKVVR